MALNAEQLAKIKDLGKQWMKATDPEVRKSLHEQANAIRAKAGLKAGKDYNKDSGKLTASYETKAAKASVKQRNKAIQSGKAVPENKKITLAGQVDAYTSETTNKGTLLQQIKTKGIK